MAQRSTDTPRDGLPCPPSGRTLPDSSAHSEEAHGPERMNPTLARFEYPKALVQEYEHWVVLFRPIQVTPLSCVIAARAEVTSLGALDAAAGAELPRVIRDYEASVGHLLPAEKFNYLALMMVDPNPHFHAIPRYPRPIVVGTHPFTDTAYPKPPDITVGMHLDAPTLEAWRARLAQHWIRRD